MQKSKIKLALVCTTGGHFEQMTNLSEFYNRFDHFWITNKNKQTESQLAEEKKYYINSGHFKKPWTYLYQLPGVIKAVSEEKPTHFLSTGSGRTALVPFLAAKFLGKKFIHIDTFSIVHGYSKFGKFLLSLNHPIFSQWEDDKDEKVTYIGPIFKSFDHTAAKSSTGHIFITLGTRREPFTRLIKAVERLVKQGSIRDRVIVQAGHTRYQSEHLEIFDFCSPDEIDTLIGSAKFIVTQESAGIGTKCLKLNTPFLVMPRDYKYRELPAKSDMNEDLHLKLEEMGYTKVVTNELELENAIGQLDDIKTGFEFDNKLAITTLNRIIEGN
jgi:UDP-N-acetylglucosamine transferase subunit ALG13/ribosomal protein L33